MINIVFILYNLVTYNGNIIQTKRAIRFSGTSFKTTKFKKLSPRCTFSDIGLVTYV